MMEFTEGQRQAIESSDGEFVVVAGAGTGKTRVLVHKYLKIYEGLCENERDPCVSILTVTFTRRAAKEMFERLSQVIPETLIRSAHISTIDAFCSRFLKENAFVLGLDSEFKVLDEVESKLLFKSIADDILEKKVDWPLEELDMPQVAFLNDTFSLINRLRQNLILPEDFNVQKVKKKHQALHRTIYLLYKGYREYLSNENLMDFSELLVTAYLVLKNHKKIRQEIQDKFKYVLVDEYQDTNPAQVNLLRMIAAPQNNYFVVGDEKQSIYGFRGADPQGIVDFHGKLDEDRKVTLVDNFRSPEPLPQLVNEVFKDVLKSYHPIKSKVEGEAKIELFLGEDKVQEAKFLASRVKAFLDAGYKHQDIVLLFRGVKNCKEYEEALRDLNIDTVTVGGMGFYQRPEIKDILSMLQVVDNPHSERELVRVLRLSCFRIKNSLLAEIAGLKEKNETIYKALYRSSRAEIKRVIEFIEYFRKKKDSTTLTDIINELLEKSRLIYQAVAQTGGRNSRMMSNLMKFITIARNFEMRNVFSSISDFANYLRELEEVRILEPEARPKVPGVVYLMPIHQAKGLEFEVVFISNLSCSNFPQPAKMPLYHFHKEEGLIIRDTDEYNKILKKKLYSNHNQEERRLLYVAMTRMKRHLVITGHKNKKGSVSEFMKYFLVQKENRYVLREKLKDYIQLSDKRDIHPAPEQVCRDDKIPDKEKFFRLAQGLGVKKNSLNDYFLAEQFGIPKFFSEKTIKKEFSVTELLTYNKCPRQYNYLINLKIPTPPADDKFSPLLFGFAVHRMLEEYYNPGGMKTKQSLKNKVVSLILSGGITSSDYKKHYAESVEEIINNLTDSEILKSKKSVIYTEKPFVLKLKDALIKGTIDRVDKSSGGVELIDYKTSKDEDIKDYLIQMGIYKIALSEIFALKVKKISICFLRTKNIKVITPPPFMELRINSIIKGIRNKIFPPVRGEESCHYCPYKSLCV